MDRFLEFWRTGSENQLLTIGFVAFGVTLLIMFLRSSVKPWIHGVVFVLYTWWTFDGLLLRSQEGAGLVYLFYGSLALVLQGIVIGVQWLVRPRHLSTDDRRLQDP